MSRRLRQCAALVVALTCTVLVVVPAAGAASDRELKLAMIDQLVAMPQVVLLGSSRVTKYDPRDVRRIAGVSAFNTGVSSGKPADAWRQYTHLLSRFAAAAPPHVVWELDPEQLRPMPGDPDPATTPLPGPSESAGPPAIPLHTWKSDGGDTFTALGFRSYDLHDRARAHGVAYRTRLRATIHEYRTTIYDGGASFPELSPWHTAIAARLLRQASDAGDTPVVFLAPLDPSLRRAIAVRGFEARRRDVLRWLADLQSQGVHLVVLDFTKPGAYRGGTTGAQWFYDGLHPTVASTRAVLRSLHRRRLLRPIQG